MTQTQTVYGLSYDLAKQTRDAYSFDYYGFPAWRACCELLLRRGHTPEQVELIMRSTLTRYAADGGRNGRRATSADLRRLLDQPSTAQWLTELFEESAAELAPKPIPSREALSLIWSR